MNACRFSPPLAEECASPQSVNGYINAALPTTMHTDNILDLIGNTPLVRLKGERIFAKAEFLNPGGSIKDRVALAMLEGAERDGRLKPDSIIVEPTSGNTGIGIALVGRMKGYQVRIVMPEGMSEERKKIIRRWGPSWC